jgi:uncharacterized repeat protein (TIGR03803 family)
MTSLKIIFAAALLAFVLGIAGRQYGQAQTYAVVYSFAGQPDDGASPNGELVQDAAGNFYGTTMTGGTNNLGTIFKLDPAGNETILYSFTGGTNDGFYPAGGLLLDTEGNLYGTTSRGTDFGGGALFELHTNGTFKRIFKFGAAFGGVVSGIGPRSRLVTNKGDLYGVTTNGGLGCEGTSFGCGIIYKMTKGGTETVLYKFTGGVDGAFPLNVIRDAEGNLYGVATSGSSVNAGTVWELGTNGQFSVLYAFAGGADGGEPIGRLTRDANGNIRGTTASGGDPTCNCGVVFRLDSSGHETVLHKFFGHGGGSLPGVGLLDVGGALYGTTENGGDRSCFSPDSGCGVLYEVGKTGKYSVLHPFAGSDTGDGDSSAMGGLTLGEDGSIYGATLYGGTGTCTGGSHPGCGVIFKYTP